MTRLEGVGDYKQVKNHTSPTPSNPLIKYKFLGVKVKLGSENRYVRAIISQRLEPRIIPKEPQENTEEESKII